jgi:hypothetical protein
MTRRLWIDVATAIREGILTTAMQAAIAQHKETNMKRQFLPHAQWMLVAGLIMTVGWGMTALAAPVAAQDAARPVPVHVQVVLEEAVFHPNSPGNRRSVVLDLERTGDTWGAVYGVARDYNMPFHHGAVRAVEMTEKALTLEVGMNYLADPWIPAAQGVYRVNLTRGEDGTYTGTYKGTFNGVEVGSDARATVYAPVRAEDHVPLRGGEHPRLLFRESDLPALRARFATPFGKAARERLERANTPAAYGLLYRLTGDRSYVEKGVELARAELAKPQRGGDPFRPLSPLAERLHQLAMLYDLAHDALPEDYLAAYRSWAGDLGYQVYFAPEALGRTNWHVVSNHVADVYAGLTLTALLLFDLAAPPPAAPPEPFLGDVLPPAADFEPGEGVPVVPLTLGRAPARWLETEWLRQVTPDDPREVFYGLERIRPVPGSRVEIGDFGLVFRQQNPETVASDDDEIGGYRLGHLLDALPNARLREPLTLVLHTVIRVDEPVRVRIANPSSRANLAQMSLAGRLVTDGQVLRLEPGLYPLTQLVQWRMRWGHIAPSLHPATDEHAAAWAERAERVREQYATRMQAHKTLLETHAATGGGDPAFARLLRLSRFTSHLHNTHAVGRGGFQGEVGIYSLEAMLGHSRLWTAWRNVMGYDLTPGMEYPDVIPRKLIGGPQDINGRTQIPNAYYAALFPAVRPEWQPDVLAAWNRQTGVTGPDNQAAALDGDTVRAFVHYPLDMAPAPVGTNLPRFWKAPDFGYYAFRSGWDDRAFIAQVFLKSMVIRGWNGPNAGTYRLRGLGQDWATGPTDRVRRREQENVVWLPGAELADGALGRLTYLRQEGETLVLSANLNEVYERRGRLRYEPYGHGVRVNPADDAPEPSGMTGMRALAFDFSGLSGAPALFATVDRIDGGPEDRRLWLFQPPVTSERKASDMVTAEPGRFVLRPREDGPAMRGHFAHPAGVEVTTDPLEYSYVKTWGTGRGATHTVRVDAMTAEGRDHFFFVATVAEGEHPEIRVEGKGLDAVVTVGRRTIRFDGEKIVLGTRQ